MIPAANAGPMTIVMLYMVLSMGVLTGAQVGYHADSRAEAEMAFDRESDELTIGNETVEIYDENGSNVTLGASAEGEPQPEPNDAMLSDRGERWLGADSEPPVDVVNDSRVRQWTPDAVGQFSRDSVNATLAFGFETMAAAGDRTAAITYQYQDRVNWSTVYLIVTMLVWSPPVAAIYYFGKRVLG